MDLSKRLNKNQCRLGRFYDIYVVDFNSVLRINHAYCISNPSVGEYATCFVTFGDWDKCTIFENFGQRGLGCGSISTPRRCGKIAIHDDFSVIGIRIFDLKYTYFIQKSKRSRLSNETKALIDSLKFESRLLCDKDTSCDTCKLSKWGNIAHHYSGDFDISKVSTTDRWEILDKDKCKWL